MGVRASDLSKREFLEDAKRTTSNTRASVLGSEAVRSIVPTFLSAKDVTTFQVALGTRISQTASNSLRVKRRGGGAVLLSELCSCTWVTRYCASTDLAAVDRQFDVKVPTKPATPDEKVRMGTIAPEIVPVHQVSAVIGLAPRGRSQTEMREQFARLPMGEELEAKARNIRRLHELPAGTRDRVTASTVIDFTDSQDEAVLSIPSHKLFAGTRHPWNINFTLPYQSERYVFGVCISDRLLYYAGRSYRRAWLNRKGDLTEGPHQGMIREFQQKDNKAVRYLSRTKNDIQPWETVHRVYVPRGPHRASRDHKIACLVPSRYLLEATCSAGYRATQLKEDFPEVAYFALALCHPVTHRIKDLHLHGIRDATSAFLSAAAYHKAIYRPDLRLTCQIRGSYLSEYNTTKRPNINHLRAFDEISMDVRAFMGTFYPMVALFHMGSSARERMRRDRVNRQTPVPFWVGVSPSEFLDPAAKFIIEYLVMEVGFHRAVRFMDVLFKEKERKDESEPPGIDHRNPPESHKGAQLDPLVPNPHWIIDCRLDSSKDEASVMLVLRDLPTVNWILVLIRDSFQSFHWRIRQQTPRFTLIASGPREVSDHVATVLYNGLMHINLQSEVVYRGKKKNRAQITHSDLSARVFSFW